MQYQTFDIVRDNSVIRLMMQAVMQGGLMALKKREQIMRSYFLESIETMNDASKDFVLLQSGCYIRDLLIGLLASICFNFQKM